MENRGPLALDLPPLFGGGSPALDEGQAQARCRPARFDVICAGEAQWALGASGRSLGLRPSGGAVNAAVALAAAELRVGLAATLADDTSGRALVARVQAAGVDVGGVVLTAARAGIFLVEGGGAAGRILPYRVEEEPPFTVPEGWSAPVLLLSGPSPVVARGAAFCKAARAARRAGTLVVVDVNARRHVWAERDPRALRAILREADVVRASTGDLAALHLDAGALREAMRREATLVLTRGPGPAEATGPFGEVVATAPPGRLGFGGGDAFTAAICAELARSGGRVDRADLWARALQRGHAASVPR